MFYQSEHSRFCDNFIIGVCSNLNFPQHIHKNFELVIALQGEQSVQINDVNYRLKPYTCAIIFPHQRHCYVENDDTLCVLSIFSPELVPGFFNRVNKFLPKNPIFSVKKNFIYAFLDTASANESTSVSSGFENDLFRQKSFIYGICSSFLQACELVPRNSNDVILLEKVLSLMDEDILENGNLRVLAKKLNYDYSYLSKYFYKQSGMTFSQYVNICRINTACRMLLNDKLKCIDIATRVGYNSLRSFNGNFKIVTGMTPTEYVSEKAH